jgi:oxygen-independent coproporphyrinogen-3 oxidase
LKYWTRQPYLGFGVDAHSMLPCCDGTVEAVRFSTPDTLEEYLATAPLRRTVVDRRAALEESFFLGLRLLEGVDLAPIEGHLAPELPRRMAQLRERIAHLESLGFLEREGTRIRLVPDRLTVSNEVFIQLLA